MGFGKVRLPITAHRCYSGPSRLIGTGRGKRMGMCLPLYGTLCVVSAVQPLRVPSIVTTTYPPRGSSHHRQSTNAAIQSIARHNTPNRIVGRVGPSLTRMTPHTLVIQARHFFHDKD